jgi:hypothetical protein
MGKHTTKEMVSVPLPIPAINLSDEIAVLSYYVRRRRTARVAHPGRAATINREQWVTWPYLLKTNDPRSDHVGPYAQHAMNDHVHTIPSAISVVMLRRATGHCMPNRGSWSCWPEANPRYVRLAIAVES